ncbi:cupin-like domain-containing protein [Nostoc muscorum FACHB-395]|jgi:hypothetical protein|nr:cupin-like domain-containing protein [Desmonostoc muscorum FACHB-395]
MSKNIDYQQSETVVDEESQGIWIIVSHAKSYHIVYFTDDNNYAPDAEGNEYFVNLYNGKLPKGMTLSNCWRWLFNGFFFVNACIAKQRSSTQTLLQCNRNALTAMLSEKIETLQRPYCPSSPLGYAARKQKLVEAQNLLAGEILEQDYPYLTEEAAISNCTVREMAQLIVTKHAEFDEMLRRTERWRESLAFAIQTAVTDADLAAIHQRLSEQPVSEINAHFVVELQHTSQEQVEQMPDWAELNRERRRLQNQLRDRINTLRRVYKPDYLLDDVMFQHLNRIAQALLSANGQIKQLPKGLDVTPLFSRASVRSQTLLEAAQEVLAESDRKSKILWETEQMKDAMLSRIAGVQSFQDIEFTSKVIRGLTLSSKPMDVSVEQVANKSASQERQPISLNPNKSLTVPKRDAATMKLRRDAVILTASSTAKMTSVPRIGSLDNASFRRRAQEGLPFVIEGLVKHWAIADLKPDTLKEQFGKLRVCVRVRDYVEKSFSPERTILNMSLADYFAQIQANSESLPPYLGNQELPELTSLCQWPDYYQQYAKPRIWLGPADTITPLHCDYDDNLFAQIFGEKRFLLYPPHHDEFLYTRKANPALYGSRFDPEAPDYKNLPLAKQAWQVECIVKPGEMLFLPAGWFHHVRSLDFSLSVNRWAHDPPMALSKEL